MKLNKIVATIVFALSLVSFGDVVADYVEGEKSTDLVTPQVQEAAAFLGSDITPMLHALKLQMTKYDMDMKSQSGRKAWHGQYIGEEIYTNELVKVEVYSNEVTGAIWRYKMPFKPVDIKPTTRKVTYSTNGIPTRLAEARARRAAQINGGVIVTNIETTANSGR